MRLHAPSYRANVALCVSTLTSHSRFFAVPLWQVTTQCASHYFIHADTVTNAFDAPALMKEFCALASVNSKDNFTISNAIVFTHSMG